MTRADFATWRTAYNNFVKCGRSTAPEKQCVAGWQRDAAKFIDAEHRDYVDGAAGYYLETRLRSVARGTAALLQAAQSVLSSAA